MDLMNMKWMHFLRVVDDSPVTKRSNVYRRHGGIGHAKLLAIDVEAALVLGKGDNEIGSALVSTFAISASDKGL